MGYTPVSIAQLGRSLPFDCAINIARMESGFLCVESLSRDFLTFAKTLGIARQRGAGALWMFAGNFPIGISPSEGVGVDVQFVGAERDLWQAGMEGLNFSEGKEAPFAACGRETGRFFRSSCLGCRPSRSSL